MIKLGAMIVLAGFQVYAMEMTPLSERHMYQLSDPFRKRHEILTIRALSNVLHYSSRDILMVELVDGSQVPFYLSTGRNSRLAKSWFPFFGIDKEGWFHKNYTFNRDNGSSIPYNLLYHYNCHILARTSLELNRLRITPGRREQTLKAREINQWIGGKLFNETTMVKENSPKQSPIVLPLAKAWDKLKSTYPDKRRYLTHWVIPSKDEEKNDEKDFFGAFGKKNPLGNSIPELCQFIMTYNSKGYLKNFRGKLKGPIHDNEQWMGDLYDVLQDFKKNLFPGVNTIYQTLGDSKLARERSQKSHHLSATLTTYLWSDLLGEFVHNYTALLLNDAGCLSLSLPTPPLDDPDNDIKERLACVSKPLWFLIKYDTWKERKNRLYGVRRNLQIIKKNNPSWFKILASYNPFMSRQFLNKNSFLFDRTYYRENKENKDYLARLQKKMGLFFPKQEERSISRIVEDFYLKKRNVLSWGQIGGIGMDNRKIKKCILSMRNRVYKQEALACLNQIIMLANPNHHYEDILENLLRIKRLFCLGVVNKTIRDGGDKALTMMAVWVYRDALAQISTLEIYEPEIG